MEQAARVYDAAAWCLGRPRQQLNFKECESVKEAQFLACFGNLFSIEQRCCHRQLQCRLTIAEADERAMEAWHATFPQDVLDEQAFCAAKKVERKEETGATRPCKRWIEAQYIGPHKMEQLRRNFSGLPPILW
jgi:hypothetical protein